MFVLKIKRAFRRPTYYTHHTEGSLFTTPNIAEAKQFKREAKAKLARILVMADFKIPKTQVTIEPYVKRTRNTGNRVAVYLMAARRYLLGL